MVLLKIKIILVFHINNWFWFGSKQPFSFLQNFIQMKIIIIIFCNI